MPCRSHPTCKPRSRSSRPPAISPQLQWAPTDRPGQARVTSASCKGAVQRGCEFLSTSKWTKQPRFLPCNLSLTPSSPWHPTDKFSKGASHLEQSTTPVEVHASALSGDRTHPHHLRARG